MTDESLRLPPTLFHAVFNLGERLAADLPLPAGLDHPALYATWDEDDLFTLHVSVSFEDGALHLEADDDGVQFHFHGGADASNGPWPEAETAQLLTWALVFTAEIYMLDDFLEQVEMAAEWFRAGLTLYVPETDPAQLTLVSVLIEGELLTLPWLGSGHVDHEHVSEDDDDGHCIALLWNPLHETPTKAIAYAWLDSESGKTVTRAEAGVDWSAVGLSEAEVLIWLEGIYENHHVGQTPEDQILAAALEVLGGIREPAV